MPGFGPRRVAALHESRIECVGDLLRRLPHRYIDRTTIVELRDIGDWLGRECTVCGTVSRARMERGRRSRLRVLIDDGTGKLEALWFRTRTYVADQFPLGRRVLLSGTVGRYTTWQMVHPRVELLEADSGRPCEPYVPVYRVSQAMRRANVGQKTLIAAIGWCLDHVRFPATLPPRLEQRHGFAPLGECLTALHRPRDTAGLDAARTRLRYEELYTLAVNVRLARRQFSLPGRPMRLDNALGTRFEAQLPFALTPGQRDALRVLLADAYEPRRMHRLLQGDVGCGKTVVAAYACLPALASGLQVAWMAPTEVLARQSCELLRAWLGGLGFGVELLTGATPATHKQRIAAQLRSGALHCVVGTHALLQPRVAFSALAMIVVDEQQRFGVAQRLTLQQKGPEADFLLMSATPIPQTLAQSIYGDLQLVTVPDRPAGRLPVETHVVPEARRADMERFVAEQIRAGGQAYWVSPRIESVDEEEEEVRDVLTTYQRLRTGVFAECATALVHGQQPPDEKEAAVSQFAAGKVGLLVATSVVEVGVDAPGATVMVVENAERFGLSQLHQLRGRVGRGSRRSYCFVLSPALDTDPQAAGRLREFCGIHDGFEIAELDLRLRGPGQAVGTGQSGWDDAAMRAILDDPGAFGDVMRELDETVRQAG